MQFNKNRYFYLLTYLYSYDNITTDSKKEKRMSANTDFTPEEMTEWAINLKSHDDAGLKWDNPSDLFKFIVRNWDFPGSYDDAIRVYNIMYPMPTQLFCLRCNHRWYSRNPTNNPKFCPSCNSPYWNKPRKIKI
jgi:hypothetical protein